MSGSASVDVAARAAGVKVIAFDVDGVLTDGRLFYGPTGCALHAFHARDGLGLVRARLAGLKLVAISGRSSENVTARLTELKVDVIRQGISAKARELKAILDEFGVDAAACAYVGDDVNDLGALGVVGLACAPADAEGDVKAAVHVVCARRGGEGVLREVVELVLRAQGRWVAGE